MNHPSIKRREFIRISGVLLAGSILAACQKTSQDSEAPPTSISKSTEEPQKTPETSPREETPAAASSVVVLAEGLDFPEGPAFDPQGNLWCTELGSGNLVRLDGGGLRRYPTNGSPNGLAFDRLGRAWVTDSGQNAIRRFDPQAETWETVADNVAGIPLMTPNDLCFDSEGNLLFTCPNFSNTDPTGYVCCLSPDGVVSKIVEQFYRPNGLDLIDDGKSLVIADTYRKNLFKGEWDAKTRTLKTPKLWAMVGGAEGPDGMCPGKDRFLYVAIYGDGSIKVVNQAGKVVQSYPLPGTNPTNAAIDPSGKLGLIVTETEKGQLLSLPEIQPGVAIFDGGNVWP